MFGQKVNYKFKIPIPHSLLSVANVINDEYVRSSS